MFLLSYLQNQGHGDLCSSSRNCIDLVLIAIFWSLVHFEFICIYGVKLVNRVLIKVPKHFNEERIDFSTKDHVTVGHSYVKKINLHLIPVL